MDVSAPSPSTDGLVHLTCVIHHRTGGYLCLSPKSNDGDTSAAVAFDRDILPYKTFLLRQKGGTSTIQTGGQFPTRTKTEFYDTLARLVGEEVSIQDYATCKYLTAEEGRCGKPSAKFKDQAQFFRLCRNDTGAYCFRLDGHKKPLRLHKSSKTRSWAMKCARGPNMNVEVDIDTSHVNFSAGDKEAIASSDWILEPEESVFVLDSLPTEQERHSLLFLGVIDIRSAQPLLEVAHHCWSVPVAWRSTEQWDRAIRSMAQQHLGGNAYCTHVGNRTKWIARGTPGGKFCLVIASSQFPYQPLEDCVDAMEEMLGRGRPTATDLRELGRQIQATEGRSADAAQKKLPENEETCGATVFQHMKDVPISLLHRSGGWFSLRNDGCAPDSLYLEPCREDQGKENNAPDDIIQNAGDYFNQLQTCPKFAIASSPSPPAQPGRPPAKCYLFSREPTNVFGKEKKRLFRNKYLVAQYAELKPGETPETFVFAQNPNQGGISIMSTSNGCFLLRNRRGGFVFRENEDKNPSSDAAEKMCCANEGGGAWFIDTPYLHSGVTSEGLLFACIVRNRDKRTLVSSHAPGRPTAWRTAESRDDIIAELLENLGGQSSTFVIDWDTGYKWFATNSDGKELFVVVATEGFPLYYGTKALLSLEHLHHTLSDNEQRPASSCEFYRVMRDIETEYRYELCFGNDEVLGLIEDVEELTDKMMDNIDALKENIATEQEIMEKATQLHVLAQQFKKQSNKKKWRVAAMTVAGGAVVGGLFGLAIGCPAGLIVLETTAAQVALSAAVGAAPGFMKGVVLLSTDAFWKRKFVNLGKCIRVRRRKRVRDKTQMELEQRKADNLKKNEAISLI